MRRAAALIAVGLALWACGYRLARRTLPEPAGGCVSFETLDGGAAYPQVAMWAGASLREEIAQDLCPRGQGGAHLVGTVEAVEQASGHHAAGDRGPVKAGGRWLARASVRIERGGQVVWGPMGVEVERDFLSTGEALTEQDAFEAHLRLLAEDLARSVADVLYGVHPVTIEAAP